MIWCVEDDASIRDIEVYALNSTGFEAEGFADGAAFWAALGKARPELVVLDVMLPEIDGIQLLRRMKADAALREILAAQQRRARQAFQAGAKIACGSDAGAYRVPHGQALRDERRFLSQALEGLAWEDGLAAGEQALQRVFAPARR